MGSWSLNFDATDLLYPQVVRGTQEVDLMSNGVQGLPKSGNPDSRPPKWPIFWRYFAQTRFSCPKSKFLPIASLKAIGLTVNLVYLGTLNMHPVTRQIFYGNELAILAETLS